MGNMLVALGYNYYSSDRMGGIEEVFHKHYLMGKIVRVLDACMKVQAYSMDGA